MDRLEFLQTLDRLLQTFTYLVQTLVYSLIPYLEKAVEHTYMLHRFF